MEPTVPSMLAVASSSVLFGGALLNLTAMQNTLRLASCEEACKGRSATASTESMCPGKGSSTYGTQAEMSPLQHLILHLARLDLDYFGRCILCSSHNLIQRPIEFMCGSAAATGQATIGDSGWEQMEIIELS